MNVDGKKKLKKKKLDMEIEVVSMTLMSARLLLSPHEYQNVPT